MNRKEVRGGGSRRGNDTDMRRKEKENRKLQLELRSEKEKLNSTMIKYQKEINEMQAVSDAFPLIAPAEAFWLHICFLVCSNWQKRVRCALSCRWLWTAKTATSSSWGICCSRLVFSPWTLPASAAGQTLTLMMLTQVRMQPLWTELHSFIKNKTIKEDIFVCFVAYLSNEKITKLL